MLPWGKKAENVKRAEVFVAECCKCMDMEQKSLGKSAKTWIAGHTWPDESSEMRRAVYSAVLTANGDVVEAVHFEPRNVKDIEAYAEKRFERIALEEIVSQKIGHFFERLGKVEATGVYRAVMKQVEKPLISLSLKWADDNQIKAARVLGINRNTLRKKIKELSVK